MTWFSKHQFSILWEIYLWHSTSASFEEKKKQDESFNTVCFVSIYFSFLHVTNEEIYLHIGPSYLQFLPINWFPAHYRYHQTRGRCFQPGYLGLSPLKTSWISTSAENLGFRPLDRINRKLMWVCKTAWRFIELFLLWRRPWNISSTNLRAV